SKNVIAGGRVQANLTGFYYQYDSLQISKIVARTSVNENIDANIWGLEGEFIFSPVDDLLFDLNLAYLNTEIKDAQSINPRDPSNGDPNFTVVKDVLNASNYVIPTQLVPTAVAAGCLLDPALGGPFGLLSLAPACQPFFSDGVPADLGGNELPSAPEFSFKVGAQYAFAVGADYALTARADYYWRSDFYARIFNQPIDKIESWDVLNAQIEIAPSDRSWYLRGYVNNWMDDDTITGMYVTDASSGLFTNVFAIEPRTWGLAFGMRFGE
ncbi:MAG TPA: TonB-dependent receptor, partial [Steroidobacter sp.]|nr:TonB-dependent receptor [Steroidobacter sp.]